MRKKLLRSRSGFEKPESREEAIMQNILGASNVLEPSESNIEEILKSILYNTPYTKQAEFDIEKILLAIKNNGTYDGEHESRDLKILFAILNDLDYTEEAESRIEELFIEWLNQRSKVKVLEGIPPLTFVAKGEPLINYEISGNTTQNGTPTPDNPIMPQGTGERTGNLWNEDYTGISGSIKYVSVYVGNGSFTLSTSCPAIEGAAALFFLTGNVQSGASTVSNGVSKNRKITVTSTDGYVTVAYRYISYATGSADPRNEKTMLNLGSTPLPYEPYGVKIPISSANTTTTVYLGEVETTRKIKKYEFTGQEDWTRSGAVSNTFYTFVSGYLRQRRVAIAICSHYTSQANISGAAEMQDGNVAFYANAGQPWEYFYVRDSNLATVADFKSYLAQQYAAGTPVTVWYVLATEETGIVNEPLMKIGNYADTLSKAQAGVAIPTNNGSTTVDVDTTVKPSNIYIEYK